ncbi:MAG: hypothetical protein V4481_03370 [Patescibacteria group bacterium]
MKNKQKELTLNDAITTIQGSIENVEKKLEKKIQESEKNIKDYVDVSISSAVEELGRMVKVGFDEIGGRVNRLEKEVF